jgi:hypothetical protein
MKLLRRARAAGPALRGVNAGWPFAAQAGRAFSNLCNADH